MVFLILFQAVIGQCILKEHIQIIYFFLSTPAEKGQFLALDLGGSRFKVLQVKVREGMGIRRGGVELEEKTYDIPKELLIGRGTEVRRRVKSSETREIQEVWTRMGVEVWEGLRRVEQQG